MGRCKQHAPPASKIKDNKVKEVQYDRHDELGDKIKGIKMLWDKVGRTAPYIARPHALMPSPLVPSHDAGISFVVCSCIVWSRTRRRRR